MLADATTADAMVHLESTADTTDFATDGDSAFEAVFAASYGFRTLTSDAFTDAATDNELRNRIAAILPVRAQVFASMTPRAVQPNAQPPIAAGFDVTLGVSELYFPAVDIQLRVGTDPARAGTAWGTWNARLVVVAIDSTTMALAS